MSLFLMMLMLGVANWFATTLVVESELFRPLRQWIGKHVPDDPESFRDEVWFKLSYLVGCHMCAGTWVALVMALFVPPLVAVPVVGYLLTALAIKGIGHLVLLLNNMGNATIDRHRAQATAALMESVPNLGTLLSGAILRPEKDEVDTEAELFDRAWNKPEMKF